MSDAIVVNYRGREIIYQEYGNSWATDCNRTAFESLAKAKEAVDKYVSNERKANFQRVKVVEIEWGTVKIVELTSIDEEGEEGWGVSEGRRSKVKLKNLRPLNEQSQALLDKIAECKERSKAAMLEAQGYAELLEKLPKFEAP